MKEAIDDVTFIFCKVRGEANVIHEMISPAKLPHIFSLNAYLEQTLSLCRVRVLFLV